MDLFLWRGTIEVEIHDLHTDESTLRAFKSAPEAREFLRVLGRNARRRDRALVITVYERHTAKRRKLLSSVMLDGRSGEARLGPPKTDA